MSSRFLEELKFTTNGIRGIANQDLTPYTCARIGQSLGSFLGADATVIIANDYRISGPMIKSSLIAGLLSTGVHVQDAGYVPTPALQKFVKDGGHYSMGLIITASHNPPEFNGIKVVDSDGIEIPPEKEREIERIYNAWKPGMALCPWNAAGILSNQSGVISNYVENIILNSNMNKDVAGKIHIVVDPGNGIACSYIDTFMRKLGVKYSTIFGEADGCFPNRVSEPTPESLTTLGKTVVERGATFGIGFDGDGDRAIFIDGKGTFHWGDESFAVILNDLLQTYKGWVVTPVSSSVLVEDVVRTHGAKLEWTKVGSITVSRRMLQLEAIIAGEENGGIFYNPHQPVRDGGMALALIAGIVSRTDGDLTSLFAALPKYHLHKETVMVPHESKERIIEYIKSVTSDEKRTLIDGVKLFKDGGSVLIRPSGTEAKFRSFADGPTPEVAQRLSLWGIKLVKECLDSR
nr:phosphoglucosamine mutase [Candidatus Sigynarchaeota archaeon]